ncbi:MAG TPA: tRNA epoxyqueuosine(34) reductase QueG [Anaeromyxobacteraceae bacterium]|nr:tRNA epoxyqueuosine(34) reductase QueG [Anaeromyxobacteraceae bacterium]
MKAAALDAGFHKVGIARAEPLDPGPLDRMLARGAEADMAWLRTQRAERLDPSRLLAGARSVVALALAYAAGSSRLAPGGRARVARYARGRDYHAVVKRRLRTFVASLKARDPAARALATVDVAPVMEKAWAERAGIGWVGKNGCLITPELGSWVVLATVLVDRELEADEPHPERCGDCSACMPACPTGAIPEPGLVDARRCLSFHTIERRGPVPEEVAGRIGRWGFGCDDCQTACPWNAATGAASDPELAPTRHPWLDLRALVGLGERAYRRDFYGTALARAGHAGLVRNAILVAGAEGERDLAPAIRRRLESDLPGVPEAARWALERLGGDGG